MTVSVLHQKVSAIADDPASVAAGEVVPSDWNASHNITMDSGFLLGRSTAGAGSAEEITVGSGLSLSGGTLSASGTTGVSSFSAGTTGFTPNTATTGDVTLAGTLAVANGGTGVTTSTGTGSVVLSTGPTFAPDVVISGSSSNSALRITQTGAGNALLVEDQTSVDASPFVVSGSGNVILGHTVQLAGAQYNPSLEVFGSDPSLSSIGQFQYSADTLGSRFQLNKTRGTAPATHTVVQQNDELGAIQFSGSDGTNYIRGANIRALVDGTPGTNDMPGRLVFSTTAVGSSSPTERMRIDNAGNVGIGGTPTVDLLRLTGTASGGTTINGLIIDELVGSGITANYRSILSRPILQNATFTLTNLYHFYANPQTKPAAATLSNQYGFFAESTLTDATVNYGFYGNIASGANRYNFYAAGTAANYFAGSSTFNAGIIVSGSVALNGSTSGTVTVSTAAAAGTWTLTLPTSAGTNGYVLSTNGAGVTSWVAQSGGGGGGATAGDNIFLANNFGGF